MDEKKQYNPWSSNNPYQEMEWKTPMTDNLKVKTGKAVDDARAAAHAVYDDATVLATTLAGMQRCRHRTFPLR
jgi:polyribonucleotide nucleotidyltransferase